MKTILITGASGFIGEYLVSKFKKDYKVIGIDTKILKENQCDYFYAIDITDEEAMDKVFEKHPIDYVIHTAAQKSLIECEKNKELAYSVNYLATIALHKLSKKVKAKFVFISSDQVFNGKEGNYLEDSPTEAINYYGTLKTLCEKELKKDEHAAICRTALTFGEIPNNQEDYFNAIKHKDFLVVQGYIVQQVIYKLSQKESIVLPKDEFITPTSVELLYKQLRRVIEKNISGILHCCGGEKISRYEFGRKIATIFQLDADLILPNSSHDELRPKDVSLNTSASSRMLDMIFWDVETMIRRLNKENILSN